MALLAVIPITTVDAIATTCQSYHEPASAIDFGHRHGTSLCWPFWVPFSKDLGPIYHQLDLAKVPDLSLFQKFNA